MALVQREQFDAALSWLYDAILRGRVEPSRGGGRRISYNFIGERRAGDGSADRFTPQRVPQP